MNIFSNHVRLYTTAGLLFAALTFVTAVMPALQSQQNNAPLPGTQPLSGDAAKGKLVYISEGCVGCHSQQVRNVEMDKMFGSRPGMPADYANMGRTSLWQNTATLMGTERTGPDLTDVGTRQPGADWHLLHLFNPRAVIPQSIMPAYSWLFTLKETPDKSDVVVQVPEKYMRGRTGKVVARPEALQLVAYLQSLKQAPLPDNIAAPEFLYKKTPQTAKANHDGKMLYAANCQSCHQPGGEGLKGAFPPLKGSTVVNGSDDEIYVDIIMNGYDARPEYGVMPPVGTNQKWTEKEIAAIINFERTSWGNNGKPISENEVKLLLEAIKTKTAAK